MIQVTFPDEQQESLDRLAGKLGVSRGETVRKALSLLQIAVDGKKDEGKDIALIDMKTKEMTIITGL